MPIIGIVASQDGKTPTAPTIGTATAVTSTSATVAYTASTYTGKGAATYTATSSPGGFTGTGASPITVSGLTSGTAYTFTVTATSTTGQTAVSGSSNSVTPVTPPSFYSIATVTLGAINSAITFSSIPSTYKSLQLRAVLSDNYSTNSTPKNPILQFNGDTAANYYWHYLKANSSTVSAGSSPAGGIQIQSWEATFGAGNAAFVGGGIVDIIDYASTSKYKTVRALAGTDSNSATVASNNIALSSGLWSSTAAINSITINVGATSWPTGTSIALYGIN